MHERKYKNNVKSSHLDRCNISSASNGDHGFKVVVVRTKFHKPSWPPKIPKTGDLLTK